MNNRGRSSSWRRLAIAGLVVTAIAALGELAWLAWPDLSYHRKLRQLDSPSCSERLEAARELFSHDPLETFVVLRDRLSYPDSCTFQTAHALIELYPQGIGDLLDTQPDETIEEILEALNDYYEVHKRLPEELRIVPELTALLHRERPDSWWLAIVILGEIGPGARSAVPEIVEILRHADDLPLARRCVEALGKIGGDYPTIISGIADYVREADDDAVTAIHAYCLPRLDPSVFEIRQAVLALANDSSPRVRSFALELLRP